MAENLLHNIADYKAKNLIKWCPWCGDFMVLNRLQNHFVQSNIPREKFVVIAWIWCAGRLPYYMNTYGFHTIHGRAPTIATGVKLTNPDLQVWVVTWDWDWLSIGWNHLLHTIRKNIWIKILLLNNGIYGLTKWQLSPTSRIGSITKTTPKWSVVKPINPAKFAISLGCSFVARTIDTEITLTDGILARAWKHDWTVFIETLQKCITFNPKSLEEIRNPEIKEDYILKLKHWEPLIFWKNKNKWIVVENFKPKIIEFDWKIPDNVIIYDETNTELAYIISNLSYPDFPIPIWIMCVNNDISYEEQLKINYSWKKSLEEILNDWEVFEI